ncbi:TonB-dependent receptor [Pseudomonas saliphila]|uniref:TonB-dependent receptor n=1 Tax=Pseudomonas saliphila TaxID=2586906 RepID=UPI00123BA27C|nr:TonB-dependent receptor [Pseudomonas saliphila]
MNRKLHPLACAVWVAVTAPALAAEPVQLPGTVVSASVLNRQSHEMTTPVDVLQGDRLVQSREATLGETLESVPGVRSSNFGPGVGRPVIRGLDGARVKVLSDGVDVLDASTVSPDHAVTSEPLLAERIEVLKGPATLLYGGGAIGGVVNVIDRKVPTYVPAEGYEADLELRGNTVADETMGALGVTFGAGNLAFRVEGMKRQADEYEIPGSPGTQHGSYNDTDSFTLGGSFIGERGYLGLAYSEQQRRYGLLAHEHADCHTHGLRDWHCAEHDEEEDHDDHDHDDHGSESVPYVDMKQKRWDVRGEVMNPLPGFELARLRLGHSQYRHDEIEGGEVGTHFSSDATDARLELTHAPLLGWRGVVGAQTLRRDFETQGEEMYVPQTLTRNHGIFLLEAFDAGDWRYELALRHEWQNIDAAGAPDTRHSGTSASAGAVWNFADDHSVGLSVSRSQRLPAAEELYANGPHAATGTVELGNPELREETSRNAELTLRKFAGPTTYSLSVFRNEVDDFIHAADTGRDIGGGQREIEYRQRDAVLVGAEGEVRHQFTGATALTIFGDHVRGELKGGDDLPRIPADRLGARVDQRFTSAVQGQLEFYRVQQQDHIALYETETAGYNMLGARLSYSGALQNAEYLVYVKANNLLDEKARQHTSFIKDDVLMPGRNFTLGVRFML